MTENARAWKTPISAVKVGTKLICDDGFFCLKEGDICEVCADENGALFIPCRGEDTTGELGSMRHYLDAQWNDEQTDYVGLRIVEVPHD